MEQSKEVKEAARVNMFLGGIIAAGAVGFALAIMGALDLTATAVFCAAYAYAYYYLIIVGVMS